MTDSTRRDLCAPGPQGHSHRPLPDLTIPSEQDRALMFLVLLQEESPLASARLLAAIHNTLYELWTAPKGSPLSRLADSAPDAWLGAFVRSLLPLTDQDNPDHPCYSATDFLQEVLDACDDDPPKTSHGTCEECEPPECPCPIRSAMADMFGRVAGDPAPYCAYQSEDRS